MFNKKVYLLYLSMLGGCNHIMHQHNMYKGMQPIGNNETFTNKKDSLSKVCMLLQGNPHKIKTDLITLFFSFAKSVNGQCKHTPELANQLFRSLMNNILPKFLSDGITDSLINSFLMHAKDAKYEYSDGANTCANACVHAIVETVLKSMDLIRYASSHGH